jgi:hypothetical protein
LSKSQLFKKFWTKIGFAFAFACSPCALLALRRRSVSLVCGDATIAEAAASLLVRRRRVHVAVPPPRQGRVVTISMSGGALMIFFFCRPHECALSLPTQIRVHETRKFGLL